MLALANVRDRWAGLLATFLAIAVGVGLISATVIVADSVRPPVQPRLASATALVVPAEAEANLSLYAAESVVPWSPAEADALAARLRSVPGVDAAVVDRSFYAQAFLGGRPAGNPDDDEAGHGWSSVRLGPHRLRSGTEPRGPDEVVVDRALGVPAGTRLTLNLAAGPKDYRVSGTLDGPGFHVGDGEARRLAPGTTTIGIVAAPGAAEQDVARAVAAVVGSRGSVLTGEDRGAVEPDWARHQAYLGNQVIAVMAVLALFTTVFVVASTMALSVAQRRREIGLLRTIGAQPGQIRRMVLGEAAVLGFLGGIAGCAAGVAIAPLLYRVLVGLDVAAAGVTMAVSVWPLLLAVAVGLLVAVVGAVTATRQAARVGPIEALADGQVERRSMTTGRWIGGATALAAGVLFAVGAATADGDGRLGLALGAGMALIVAAGLLCPILIAWVVRATAGPAVAAAPGASGASAARRVSATVVLVRAELLAATRRAAATAAPVIAAVGFAALFGGMIATMAVAYPAETYRQLAGQAMIGADGTPGLSDAVLAGLDTSAVIRAPLPTVLSVPGPEGITVVDGVGALDRDRAGPGGAVLSETMATSLGVRAGSTIPVRFADGASEPVRVAEVLPPDPTRGDFVLARDTVRAHDPSSLAEIVVLPGDRAPASVGPGARILDAESYALADYETDARTSNGLVTLLIAISVGYSGLAVAGSTAMAAHGRRRDLAVLRSAGATRAQLVRTALAETTVVVVIGAVVGLAVTIPPLAGMASGLSGATGTDVALQMDPATTSASVAGCLALALLSTLVVTLRTTRNRPS